MVPLKVYFKDSLVKRNRDLAMARGKSFMTKRQDIAKRRIREEKRRDFKVKIFIDRLVSTEKSKSMIKMRGMRNDRGTGKRRKKKADDGQVHLISI